MTRRTVSQLCSTTTLSYGGRVPRADHGWARGTRRTVRSRRATSPAAWCAHTSASSRELLARRLAPCSPVRATSPSPSSPRIAVRPARSATMPPHM